MPKEDENYVPIMYDIDELRVEEGFYIDKTLPLPGLAYVSLDDKIHLWVIDRHYQKPEDSAYLTEDDAKGLQRVKRPSELAEKLKLELKFMKRKVSEFFTQ